MYLLSRAFLDDLAARLTGPMNFRFILQPAMAVLAARNAFASASRLLPLRFRGGHTPRALRVSP